MENKFYIKRYKGRNINHARLMVLRYRLHLPLSSSLLYYSTVESWCNKGEATHICIAFDAKTDGPIGTAVYAPVNNRWCKNVNVGTYVLPKYRNMGVGKKLYHTINKMVSRKLYPATSSYPSWIKQY